MRYYIKYNNGYKDNYVEEEKICLIPKHKFNLGEEVAGNYQNKGTYYPGVIQFMTIDRGTIKYLILYKDGYKENDVEEERIRFR